MMEFTESFLQSLRDIEPTLSLIDVPTRQKSRVWMFDNEPNYCEQTPAFEIVMYDVFF